MSDQPKPKVRSLRRKHVRLQRMTVLVLGLVGMLGISLSPTIHAMINPEPWKNIRKQVGPMIDPSKRVD